MSKQRVIAADLLLGQALPWNIYSENGSLLLRKGHVISSESQIASLVNRGAFIEEADLVRTQPGERPEIPSTLRMMNAANLRLQRLLFGIENEPGLGDKLLEVAKMVLNATELNSEVALACIFHNNKEGIYAVRHCIDTAVVSLLIAKAMDLTPDEVLKITVAALTMNVGMIKDQERMQEINGPLPPSEVDLVKHHPQAGVELLKRAGIEDEEWLSFVLRHHENENGTGYPGGKLGKEIARGAKIISIADRYCARVSSRKHRKSLLPNAALRNFLVQGKDTDDRSLVTFFIRVLGTYPIGTYVRLENGEIGIVVAKGPSTTAPVVLSLIGPRGAPLTTLHERDTSKQLNSIREVLSDEKAAVRFTLQQIWGDVAAV